MAQKIPAPRMVEVPDAASATWKLRIAFLCRFLSRFAWIFHCSFVLFCAAARSLAASPRLVCGSPVWRFLTALRNFLNRTKTTVVQDEQQQWQSANQPTVSEPNVQQQRGNGQQRRAEGASWAKLNNYVNIPKFSQRLWLRVSSYDERSTNRCYSWTRGKNSH